MTESEFNELIDRIFYALELRLDEIDSDMDYEASGGVLTITGGNFNSTTDHSWRALPPCAHANAYHPNHNGRCEQGSWT